MAGDLNTIQKPERRMPDEMKKYISYLRRMWQGT